MPALNPLALTTELAAVNRLLSAVGEAPISNLTTSTREDVILAATLLREVALEVQSIGWRFNREFGYALEASDTYAWTGTDGSTATLNVFTPPDNLITAKLTQTAGQADYDLVIRPPRLYVGAPLVFYDRALNRDGLEDEDIIYIDPIWYFEFDELPEIARKYIVVKAGRLFVEQHIGASEMVGFTLDDIADARRALDAAEGEEDAYNIFDSMDVQRIYSNRRRGASGIADQRYSP